MQHAAPLPAAALLDGADAAATAALAVPQREEGKLLFLSRESHCLIPVPQNVPEPPEEAFETVRDSQAGLTSAITPRGY